MHAVLEHGKRVWSGADMIIAIGEIICLADDTDMQSAGEPALAYPGIEHRCLMPRISADKEQRVRLFKPHKTCIEEIEGPLGGVEHCAILPAIEIL